MPDVCLHVWRIFLDLHGRRGSNGFGPSPITEQEIYFYCLNRHIELSPEELYLLGVADDAAREQMSKNAELERGIK